MNIKAFAVTQAVVDDHGRQTKPFIQWIASLVSAFNGLQSVVSAAVPSTRRVVTSAGLAGGGALSADVGIGLYRAVDRVASLPTTGNAPGQWAFALDGRKPGEGAGAGTGCPVWWGNSAWFTTANAVVTA